LALEKDPKNAIGYNLLGMAYRFKFNQSGAQEFKDKEIESFKKAIEIDSKFWAACKNLSASLYYQGRKKEAVPYLEKALELQPNDPEKVILLQWIEEGKNIK
jgi:tetratricopeptide (TPR) repeat protein